MFRKIPSAVGIAAVAATIGVLVALALAAASADEEGSVALAKTYVAETPAPPPRPASERKATPPPLGPVPAVVEKPVRGPAFAIARLRAGTRAALWQQPGRGFITALGPQTEFGSPVILSVVKTTPGWLGVATPEVPNGQLGWIRRDPGRVEVYWTKYWLGANLSARRLTLHYGRVTLNRFLVTIGGPGSETPTGRFGVTDALQFDESPYYGCCALALSGRQTHLPIGWIGGDRIAIHGTPGAVGGAESHGCLRATDATMRLLFDRLPLGAPVFIRP